VRYFIAKKSCVLSAVASLLASVAVAETPTPTTGGDSFLEMIEAREVYRQLNVPVAGLYAVRAPANTNIEIFVDGVLLIDATGTRMAEVGETIVGLVTLEPGDHVIAIKGLMSESEYLGQITINKSGQEPSVLTEVSTEIDADAAAGLVASRSILGTPSESVLAAGAPAGTINRTPFLIGGGSSRMADAERTAAFDPSTQSPSGTMANASTPQVMQNGGADVAPTRTSASMAGAGLVSGGGATSGGGGGGGMNGGSDPGSPAPGSGGGTPPAPTPTPTPTPTPAPPAVSDPNTPAVSPLTPPPNVEVDQAIQLVSAGNEEGIVPNTGTTLFGAAMDNTMFDTVQVSLSPSNRTTTVDIGSQTGQFAVRLFPEDFSAGENVTVTLTGMLSGNTEVESVPVSYTVQGRPPQDGVGQALSRLTYGATPELYARIRSIGFEAYVREQLDPASIDDRAFESTNPEGLLNRTTDSSRNMFRSLLANSIAHAAYSEKQLQVIMGNFWANHFHAVTKGTRMYQQNITDREFFRENAFGNFEDLLLYSAQSPLMSQYLDNDENRRGRPNQNYGREILELSTVGVDAGYDETDIDAVAQIFTGWAYEQTNPDASGVAREYRFNFFPERHQLGDKTVPFLGVTIAGREGPAGVEEGEELIAILAQNVNTREFVCGKIVQLLVADQPPANLVQACSAAWQASGGEVVPMLEAILLDPSYITQVEYQRTKVKTPFEYAASVIRAFGAEPTADRSGENFYGRFREMFEAAGYVPLNFAAPTGLPEVGDAWTSSATLVTVYDRMGDLIRSSEAYGVDLLNDIQDANIESAEEVAAYLLTIATADRFTSVEFENVVAALKGEDGVFDPFGEGMNETAALRRAMGVIAVSPSFLLQ